MKEGWRDRALETVMRAHLLDIFFCAFSPAQRNWFLERDDHQCQFPVDWTDNTYKPCSSQDRLEIHHRVPQRYSKEILHKFPDEIDTPDNGITLCHHHHQEFVHPDMLSARHEYGKNKQSFQETFNKRDKLLAQGQAYWNQMYDTLFIRIIEARNKLFDKPFPKKR